ncbi:MAG: methylenetetrahydrofolate reductase [Clostridia bacterium]|nr:methylenetetrahydrofolate reductase [Clostridia bacterium]
MKISEYLKKDEFSLSFEVFPPKTDASLESVRAATVAVAKLGPDFVSVTCGAGGGGGRLTLDIAQTIRRETGVETLEHLTCVGAKREAIQSHLETLKAEGMENIMALRGDLPAGVTQSDLDTTPYPHAVNLVREIKASGDFCVGAACYPEVHPESRDQRDDLCHLKEKVDAGVDFLTTQMFFDNNLLYNFLYKLRETGVTVPVLPGIMPITGANQVERARKLSGSFMPRRFTSLVDRFGSDPAAMKQAGIIYATDQIIDLFANGIRHVHVYTMNKPDVAAAIQQNLSAMLGSRL